MTLETPLILEATGGDAPISYDAYNLRTLMDAVWSTEGVCGLTDLVVTQRAAGANMSVDVSAGTVIIKGDAIANQGKYVCRSTAVTNLTITTAPGTGSRTDLIVAQLYDKQADGGTLYSWTPLVVTGSTTAPASSVVLAQVVVPAGTASITTASNITTNVSPTRQFAQNRQAAYRPSWTVQASDGSYSTTSNTNFTSGQWPALTATLPPSGQGYATISGDIVSASTSSKLRIDWTLTSSDGAATAVAGHGLQVTGGELQASRRTVITGTPGTTVTLQPFYSASATGAGNSTSLGLLLFEPII